MTAWCTRYQKGLNQSIFNFGARLTPKMRRVATCDCIKRRRQWCLSVFWITTTTKKWRRLAHYSCHFRRVKSRRADLCHLFSIEWATKRCSRWTPYNLSANYTRRIVGTSLTSYSTGINEKSPSSLMANTRSKQASTVACAMRSDKSSAMW